MVLADAVNRVIRRVPAWPIYAAGAALPAWLVWTGATGGLGADPVKTIERTLGLWALKLIVMGLCITPLRRFAGVNLLKYRRALGLLAFFYVILHFLAWLVLDMGMMWAQALGDIVKRPYVTLGMAALLMLLPLAATSNDRSLRRLGPVRWRRLHRLVYPAALLGAIHFLWLVKAWPPQPMVYLGVVILLLLLRVVPADLPRGRKQKGAAQPPPFAST
ncbi:MAG: protein-methionine-sulfoxide reductase heme-binding subunit MsrQ [Albidovulum sp.]